MIKVKNVRAGIVIIADAGLKLAPGEAVSVERLTPQMTSAVNAGLLRTDSDSESKPKPKSQPKAAETKPETTDALKPASDSSGAQTAGSGEANNVGKDDGTLGDATSGVKSAGK